MEGMKIRMMEIKNRTLGLVEQGEIDYESLGNKNITLIFDNSGCRFVSILFSDAKTMTNRTETIFPFCFSSRNSKDSTTEIASAILLKKLLDRPKNIKIVLVVNHSSIRLGGDTGTLMNFLERITELVKNSSKFESSIGLVVNNVENRYIEKDGSLFLVGDDKIIDGVMNFSNKTQLLKTRHEKIRILRCPEAPGELVLEEIESIKRMLAENLEHSMSEGSDFDKFISNKTLNDLNWQATEISTLIVSELKTHLEMMFDKPGSISGMYNSSVIEIPEYDITDFGEWVDKTLGFIKETSNGIEVQLVGLDESLLRDLDEHLKLLHYVNPRSNTTQSQIWSTFLRNTQDFLNDLLVILRLFVFFLGEYHPNKITQYENIIYFRQLQDKVFTGLENEGQYVELVQFREFFDSITRGKRYLLAYDLIKNARIYRKWAHTAEIWLSTSKWKCHGAHELRIEGKNVLLSDLGSMGDCPAGTKHIQIWAERIYIDADFIKEGIQMTIVSPVWEIVGSRKIILDGKHGPAHLQDIAKDGREGMNPSDAGTDGEDGSPGFMGGYGGFFQGIGLEIIGDGNLLISVNGGKGGPGQNGGKGGDGAPGRDPIWPTTESPVGGLGGSGGNGGPGGAGGSPGKIHVFIEESFRKIEKLIERGIDGSIGLRGLQGRPGKVCSQSERMVCDSSKHESKSTSGENTSSPEWFGQSRPNCMSRGLEDYYATSRVPKAMYFRIFSFVIDNQQHCTYKNLEIEEPGMEYNNQGTNPSPGRKTGRNISTQASESANLHTMETVRGPFIEARGEAVLVLGRPGTGKTTISLLSTTDGADLHSKEIIENSGDFIIVDAPTNKITKSTIIPERMVDYENGTFYYDLPGFGNTRNATLDIASTYSIKNTIDRLERIKFLLIVDYSSVQSNSGTDDFIESIQHVTRIINNVSTLKNSIALVVTKVDNRYENSTIVPDEKVISEIVGFLRTVNSTSLENELINAFQEGKCKKLAILRRPNRVGENFSKQSLALRKMTQECLTFQPVGGNDFGYTISEETEYYLWEMFEKVHEDTTAQVKSITTAIRNKFLERENTHHDLHELYDYLNEGFEQVHLIKSKMVDSMSLADFGNDLRKLLETFNVQFEEDDFVEFDTGDEHIRKFRDISRRKWLIDWSKLMIPLEDVLFELDQISAWYGFLLKIHFRLSQCRMYKSMNLDQMKKNISGIVSDNFNKELTGMMFHGFFQQIDRDCGIYASRLEYKYKKLLLVHINQVRVKALLEIVSSALRNDLSISYIGKSKEWRMTGGYVKLSEVPWKTLNENGTRAVSILASKKVYIDTYVDMDLNIVKLTIIAPVWKVSEYTKIRITGSKNKDDTAFLGVGEIFQEEPFEDSSRLPLHFANPFKDIRFIRLGNETIQMWKNLDYVRNSATCHLGFKAQEREQTYMGVRMYEWTDAVSSEPNQSSSRHQSGIINDFKIHLIESMKEPVSYGSTRRMLDLLNTNTCVRKLYDTWGFVDELLKLGETHEPYLLQYESLMKRIQIYTNTTTKVEDKKILGIVLGTCKSKIWSLKNDLSNNWIIDISIAFEKVKNYFNKMKNSKKLHLINQYSNDYRDKTGKEIGGLLNHLEENVIPELERIMSRIDEKMRVLLDEIRNLRDGIAEERRLKIKKRKELKELVGWRIALRVLQGIGTIASFFGPWGLLVGGTIAAVSSGIGAALDRSSSPSSKRIIVSPEIMRTLNEAQEFADRVEKKNRDILDKQIDIIVGGKIKYSEELSVVEKTLVSIRSKKGRIDMKTVRTTLRKIEVKLRYSRAASVVNAAMAVDVVADTVGDLVAITGNHLDSMTELDAAIQEDGEKINQLIVMENYMMEILIPALDDAQNYIRNMATTISTESRVSFNLSKWSINTVVRNIQAQLSEVSHGFQTDTEITNCWNQLKDVIDHLTYVYDQIHNARESTVIVDTIAKINSAEFGESLSNDEELNTILTKMGYSFRYNVLLGEYNRFIEALKVSTFPFVSFYLTNKIFNEESVIGAITEEIETLELNLREWKATAIKGMDDQIRYTRFSSREHYENPFFVWNQRENGKSIADLLTGKEIILVADIAKSELDNAVKFNKIEFFLNGFNETIQSEIDEILLDFEINLKHLGTSRYKCGNKSYVILSGEHHFDYSFAKLRDEPKTPLEVSGYQQKIMNVDAILSPYASWKMKLRKRKNRRTGFEPFAKYRNLVDIELAGYGSYVVPDAPICESGLEHYYTVDSKNLPPTINSRSRRAIPESPTFYKKLSSWFYNHESQNTLIPSSFDCNGTVMLMELFARKCTGSKQNSTNLSDGPGIQQDALVLSINITNRFEKLVRHNNISMGNIQFDPCMLMDELKSNMLKGNHAAAQQIMYDFVTKNNPNCTGAEFLKDLKDIIILAMVPED